MHTWTGQIQNEKQPWPQLDLPSYTTFLPVAHMIQHSSGIAILHVLAPSGRLLRGSLLANMSDFFFVASALRLLHSITDLFTKACLWSWPLVFACGVAACPFMVTVSRGRSGMAMREGGGFSHNRGVWVKTGAALEGEGAYGGFVASKYCIIGVKKRPFSIFSANTTTIGVSEAHMCLR